MCRFICQGGLCHRGKSSFREEVGCRRCDPDKGHAGESFADEDVPIIALEPDINSMAWQRGSFIFDKTPLREVLETLSKHYKVSFAATDLDKQLRGEFYAEDLDLIISLIESALDVHIVKK